MPPRLLFPLLLALAGLPASPLAQGSLHAARIQWSDIAPLGPRLESQGVTAATFDGYVRRTHDTLGSSGSPGCH